jgi:hypothetical protein
MEVISLSASSSVTIRSSGGAPASQAWVEPSWNSIIPGSGLRSRRLRWTPRLTAGFSTPRRYSTDLVQV